MAAVSAGLSYLQGLTKFGVRPGLERIERLLDGLDRPHLAYPCVHVAGTNGKGGTAAMIAAILRATGLRVGLYTSPHLISYHERIRVDGSPISDDDLAAGFDAVIPLAEAIGTDPDLGGPTEFEVGTALAFLHFARSAVDVAVVEVGLGGRWDATNVIEPEVAVITPIGMDHTDRLGSTLEAIAGEKAGIIKAGRPVVLGVQPPAARRVLLERAERVGAPVIELGGAVSWRVVRSDRSGVWCSIRARGAYDVHLGLLGSHQAENAAAAVAACEVLAERGFPIGEQAIRSGLAGVVWPGRMQLIGERPLVLLDGAKNPQAALTLARGLTEVIPDGTRLVFVVGVQGDKALESMLAAVLPLGAAAVATQASSSRLAPFSPEALAQSARRYLADVCAVCPAAAALEEAIRRAGPDGAVCAWGSLYLIGELLAYWRQRGG
ncbi:MAG TPA: folylpolyglutamate synthase/dihydrofolate synthase family protein [Limnochordia bacterium]